MCDQKKIVAPKLSTSFYENVSTILCSHSLFLFHMVIAIRLCEYVLTKQHCALTFSMLIKFTMDIHTK